jgi:1,2-phenylacetyl-CoA epoxidase PaaB subunit
MSVRIMTGRVWVVVETAISAIIPLETKKLVAVFFDELHILVFGNFSRKWKMKSSGKL